MLAADWNEGFSRIVENPMWILLGLAALGISVTGWSLSNVVSQATRTAAIQNAQLLSESVAAFRSLYTTEIVAKLETEGITPSHDHADDTGSIPLPINLSLRLAREIGREHLSSNVSIYSPHPFPWKKGSGGLPDQFAQDAWRQLSATPDEPVMGFEERDGRTVLRYATADRMNEDCVRCHNSYPGTPRNDWKVGEIRGVVEVALPLDSQLVASDTGIRQGIIIFSFLGALWLAVAGLSLWASRKATGNALAQACRFRTTCQELQEAVVERELAEKETRQLESQVQQAQKLESLSLMTGGLAHDFNNLLVPIIANADILRVEVPAEVERQKIVREIDMAASRAADLCHQMLAYAGKANTERTRVDLNHQLEETSQLLAVSIGKNCKLELDLAEDLPLIDVDVVQIGQIVLNLLTNASEASDEKGGTIRIRTGQCEISQPDEGIIDTSGHVIAGMGPLPADSAVPMVDAVFFEVYDDGIGMDEATLQKIFDPFYSTKFTGRGLGLAAVQGIVRAHGGSIHVTSEPGRFTCMRVNIPAAEQRTVTQPSSSLRATESWTGSGTILLADDEPAVQEVAKRMLENIGFDVETANDGAAATALFSKTPDRFVAVLLDLTMPRGGGVRSLQAIRTIRPDLPAVLFSGYSEQLDELSSIDDRTTFFIQKPFRSQTLREKLRTLLDDAPAAETAGASAPPESPGPTASRAAWLRRRRTGSERPPASGIHTM